MFKTNVLKIFIETFIKALIQNCPIYSKFRFDNLKIKIKQVRGTTRCVITRMKSIYFAKSYTRKSRKSKVLKV